METIENLEVLTEPEKTEPPLLEYDLDKAYEFLREKGLSARASDEELARYFAKRVDNITGDDYRKLRRQASASELISAYTGARDPGRVGTFLEGGIRSSLSSVPASVLAVKGAKAGFTLNPIPFLPAKLLTGLIGGLAGFFLGGFGGRKVEEATLPTTPVVPSRRPFLEAGKTTGDILSLAYPTQLFFKGVAKDVAEDSAERFIDFGSSRFLKNIGDIRPSVPKPSASTANKYKDLTAKISNNLKRKTGKSLEFVEKAVEQTALAAKRSPGAFLGTEAALSVPLGIAGGVAEAVDPGDVTTRIGTELATGVFLPSRILGVVVNQSLPTIKRGYSSIKTTGENLLDPVKKEQTLKEAGVELEGKQRDLAARGITEQINQIREDQTRFNPETYEEELIQLLDDFDLRDIDGNLLNLTPGQITNDPILMALENTHSAQNSVLGDEIKEAGKIGLRKIGVLMRSLSDSKNVDAIKAVAKIKEEYMKELFRLRLERVGFKAIDEINKVVDASRAGRVDATGKEIGKETSSLRIKELAEEAVQDWRKIERAAYKEVDKTLEITPLETVKVWNRIKEDEIVEGVTPINSTITDFLRKIGVDVGETGKVSNEAAAANRAFLKAKDNYETAYLQSPSPLKKLYDEVEENFAMMQRYPEAFNVYGRPHSESREAYRSASGELAFASIGEPRSLDEIIETFGRRLGKRPEIKRDAQFYAELADRYSGGVKQEGQLRPIDTAGGLIQPIRKRIAKLAEKKAKELFAKEKADKFKTSPSKTVDDGAALPEVKNISSGDILKVRGNFLAFQRQLIASGDRFGARMFGQLAEGILDDLAVKGKNLIEGADPADSLAQKNAERIETALNISRIGNDIFTRAFAGDVLAKKRTGAARITPELLSERIFAGTTSRAALNFADLENAMLLTNVRNKEGDLIDLAPSKFDEENGTVLLSPETLREDALARAVNYRQSIRDILAITAKETIDGLDKKPLTELTSREVKVNKAKLEKFLKNNEGLFELEALAPLKETLISADENIGLLIAAIDKNSGLNKAIDNSETLQRLLHQEKGRSIHTEVANILNSDTPRRDFRKITRMFNQVSNSPAFKKDPGVASQLEKAREGLLDTVLDWALLKSQETMGGVVVTNPEKLKNALFQPIGRGKDRTTVMELLEEARVTVDPEGVQRTEAITSEFGDFKARLSKLLDASTNIYNSLKSRQLIKEGAPTGLKAAAQVVKKAAVGIPAATFARTLQGLLGVKATLQAPAFFSSIAQKFILQPHLFQTEAIKSIVRPGGASILKGIIEEGLQTRNFGKTTEAGQALVGKAKTAIDKFLTAFLGSPAVLYTPTQRAFGEAVLDREMEEAQPLRRQPRPAPPPVQAPPPVAPPVAPPVQQPVGMNQPEPARMPLSQAAPSPVTRGQYAAMFPMDSATTMMRQQQGMQAARDPMQRGIGSLFG